MVRVSSAATMSARFSVSIARRVISPRFPMGVATTYNPGSNAASLGSPMSRFNALLLLFITSLVSPAFSADPQPGTTTASQAAPRDDDIDPATGLARSSVVRPLVDVPPVPDPRRVPARARPHIALILPMTSPSLGRLADAVRQGFAAAAEAGGREAAPVNVTGIENEGPALLDACRNAQAAGAVLVVAALTRDGAEPRSRGAIARASRCSR